MYCERCGKQIDDAINFCNACGAQLKKSGETDPKSVLNSLITSLIVVATAGIGVLAGMLAILLDRIPNIEPVIIFAICYLATIFGICFMIMRQVSKLIDAKLAGKNIFDVVPASQPPFVRLPPKNTAQLEDFREPASVTDITTRTLDEVPISRQY